MKKHYPFLFFVVLILISQDCAQNNRARALKPTVEITTASGNPMILIPGGWFQMGGSNGNADEQPAHKVWVSAFALDKLEVNQENYEKLMLAAPSHFKGQANPVEQVRWSDAAKYCNALSRKEGLQPCYNEDTYECNFEASGYRLPAEAEWEYACRAGADTAYDFGNDPQKLSNFAWHADNAKKRTARGGTKKPNAWGLMDMYGNVSEWCYDRYDAGYYRNSPEKDPRGPAQGDKRVLRGGAWNSSAAECRAGARVADTPGITDACFARDSYGFRCARKLTSAELDTLKPSSK